MPAATTRSLKNAIGICRCSVITSSSEKLLPMTAVTSTRPILPCRAIRSQSISRAIRIRRCLVCAIPVITILQQGRRRLTDTAIPLEVELIPQANGKSIFENARISGGDSNNVLVVGDQDNLVYTPGYVEGSTITTFQAGLARRYWTTRYRASTAAAFPNTTSSTSTATAVER